MRRNAHVSRTGNKAIAGVRDGLAERWTGCRNGKPGMRKVRVEGRRIAVRNSLPIVFATGSSLKDIPVKIHLTEAALRQATALLAQDRKARQSKQTGWVLEKPN